MLAAAATAGLLAAWLSPGSGWSNAWLDAQLGWLAPREASTEVLVVDIDDRSLATLKPTLGAWPYKRDVYALAVEQLRELGATAIAIDILLADAGPGDEALARAIARPGAPVLLAAAGLRHASDGGRVEPQYARASAPAVSDPVAAAPAHEWPALALPAASVRPAAGPVLLGVITVPLDGDGVLRRLPLWHQDATHRAPVMPWAVRLAMNQAAPDPPPLDRNGAFLMSFPGEGAWPEVRGFAELMDVALGGRDAGALRQKVQGRAVYIGSSALLADAVLTPRGQVNGTVALAQAHASLGQGQGVRPPAPAIGAALLALGLLPALLAVRRGRPSPRHDVATAVATAGVVAGLGLWLLLHGRQPSDVTPPLAALAAGLAMAQLLHRRGQEVARQRLAHRLAVTEEATRAKSAFLANVSHEIRTPLNALLGVAELLARSELTPQQRRQVEIFTLSGRDLHALINDLLDLSKMEAGRLELRSESFDLHRTLDQVADLLRPVAQAKGLLLSLDRAADLPRGVRGDRLRVEQVLANLAGNALKFTPRGEVRVCAWPDPDTPGVVRFEVSDTGIGIAPSKLDLIFEPFVQADSGVTRSHGGTGLGLAITRQLCQLMGGSVEVRSAPAVGSTFTVRLPLPAADLPVVAAPAAPTTRDLPQREQPWSVLLAEDNEVNVYIFRAMLEGQPLALEVASDGPSALALLQRRRYDIAFLDVQMPGMDGLSVTRELRALEASERRLRTPVVALTANAFASDVEEALAAGCDRHLGKPVSRDDLIAAIAQLGLGSSALAAAPTPAVADADALPERRSVLRGLGGDADAYRRLTDHAVVFLSGWASAFERARTERNLDQAALLLRDLAAVAGSIGAAPLAALAADTALRIGAPTAPEVFDEGRLRQLLTLLNAAMLQLRASA